MARRRASSPDQSLTIDLTSCLDMIFNLLAFFMITFNPPKAEKNFDVGLPPPKVEKKESEGASQLPISEEQIYEDITIALGAAPDGSLASIRMEGKPVPNPRQLAFELDRTSKAVGGATGERIEAATIVADPKLKYRHLIAIVDACHLAEIKKINFSGRAGGGG